MSTSPHESDRFAEAFTAGMTALMNMGGRLAEGIARSREQSRRQAEQTSSAASAQLEARIATERAQARADLAVVDRPEWWETASAEEVSEAWVRANAWRGEDPEIEAIRERMAEEARTRWGVELRDSDGPDGTLADLERARAERSHQDMEEAEGRASVAETPREEAEATEDAGEFQRDADEHAARARDLHPAERDNDPGAVAARAIVGRQSTASVDEALASGARPTRGRKAGVPSPRRGRQRSVERV